MKKALQRQEIAFLCQEGGQIYPEETCIDEIVMAVNRGIKGEWGDATPESIVCRKLYEWICRYLKEGATEAFLNDLNSDLRDLHYFNYVVPADFYAGRGDKPHSVYVVDMERKYSPATFAAKEFSRFVTYGMLDQIRRCQSPNCQNIFIGRPQAKWCSKACGSKVRVTKKRKRDSS